MYLGEIVIDSLVYPFLELKKFLILGILVLISTLYNIPQSLGIQNIAVTVLLAIIGLLFAFLAQGYAYRNLKFSLESISKPPEFNNWVQMFVDGIKVFIVFIVYIIPATLILVFVLSSIAITILYLIIIAPILAMAIAHMANNSSKISYAFSFREIINKIGSIGWGNFIKWYLVNIIILILISFIVVPLTMFLIKLNDVIGIYLNLIFISLILAPYIYLYISRSIALFYKSGITSTKGSDGSKGYLVCAECGGY
jgi:hypothetical protein